MTRTSCNGAQVSGWKGRNTNSQTAQLVQIRSFKWCQAQNNAAGPKPYISLTTPALKIQARTARANETLTVLQITTCWALPWSASAAIATGSSGFTKPVRCVKSSTGEESGTELDEAGTALHVNARERNDHRDVQQGTDPNWTCPSTIHVGPTVLTQQFGEFGRGCATSLNFFAPDAGGSLGTSNGSTFSAQLVTSNAPKPAQPTQRPFMMKLRAQWTRSTRRLTTKGTAPWTQNTHGTGTSKGMISRGTRVQTHRHWCFSCCSLFVSTPTETKKLGLPRSKRAR